MLPNSHIPPEFLHHKTRWTWSSWYNKCPTFTVRINNVVSIKGTINESLFDGYEVSQLGPNYQSSLVLVSYYSNKKIYLILDCRIPVTGILCWMLVYIWTNVLSLPDEKYLVQYYTACYVIAVSCIVHKVMTSLVLVTQSYCFVVLKVILNNLFCC